MKRIILLICCFLMSISGISAKVRLIYINQVLRDAKSIRIITVVRYSDSLMFYKVGNSPQIFSINCKSKKLAESERLKAIKIKAITPSALAGSWPAIGQKVLIVIDTDKRAVLFAKKIKDDYRFWDPNSIPFANSIFVIPKERPFKPLEDCDNIEFSKMHENRCCSDGCLVTAINLKEKG